LYHIKSPMVVTQATCHELPKRLARRPFLAIIRAQTNFKTMNENMWALKDLDIYEGIPESELCVIAPGAFEKTYSKDVQLYSPHEPVGYIFVVKRGEVILYHSKEGKRAVFDVLGPGSVFGTFDAANKTPNHFAQTTKNTLLCVTPVEEFLKIVSRHPEIMLRLMQRMAMRINDYEQKIRSSIDTASEKVYFELVRLKDKKQKSILGKIMPIPLQVTHEQIAELTNLNRVTVTRSIKKLKNAGLITVDKGTGVIDVNITSALTA
jgi:CRP-like cAMP-binding protein